LKILVIDDEKLLVKGIKFNLENEGYEVDAAYDGAEGLEMIRTGGYDLVLLDLMLPSMSGHEVCARVREFSTVPIIMLTAKDDDSDKIMGFESGADDYLTKPFNMVELKARIRALLRRAGATSRQSRVQNDGEIYINYNSRNAVVNGQEIELTTKEFELLDQLMKTPGRVYSRDAILNLIWGYDYLGDLRTVDVHIRRLREKIEPDPANPIYVMTKWGIGYYFKEQKEGQGKG